MTGKVVIAGGSGFLGSALARSLATAGADIVILSRQPASPSGRIRTVVWDGRTVGLWAAELEGAAAVVNLAGRSVACRFTAENRRLILASRLDSVRAIAAATAGCRLPPAVLVQASAVGIYGDSGDRICTEASAPSGTDFIAGVAKAWEEAFFAAEAAGGPRRVALRIGFVLGRTGGALAPLAKLARFFLGGSAGNGKQYLSWIHVDDVCAIVRWVIERPGASGVYHATGPAPVTQAEFMRALRRALGRPWSPPAPAWAVRLGARFFLRVDPDLALTGQRCPPRRLLDEGFRFQWPVLPAALADLLP